jgi:hypothetical protein
MFVSCEGDYFTVELRSSEVSATRRVWGYTDCQFLVNLLDHLSHQSHGWDPPVEWSSIESDFGLRFRSDPHGHVFVEVEMRRCDGEEDWQLKAEIRTELGQLSKVAASASSFFQCSADG